LRDQLPDKVIQVQEGIQKAYNDIGALGLSLEEKLRAFEKNWKAVHKLINALFQN
jgi:hypothetical protein